MPDTATDIPRYISRDIAKIQRGIFQDAFQRDIARYSERYPKIHFERTLPDTARDIPRYISRDIARYSERDIPRYISRDIARYSERYPKIHFKRHC